jgi:hypothetical protein
MTFDKSIRTFRMARLAVLAAIASAVATAAPAFAAEGAGASRGTEYVLSSPAMNVMLRADRDKDGVLSREELDDYDLTMGRRFSEVDWDQNGRLTLYELEFLLSPPAAPSIGATR